MEELYAELLLWYVGFHDENRYNNLLDEKFLNNPDNDLYLDLESYSFDLEKNMERFKLYWNYECGHLDPDLFGARLFAGLKVIYDANSFEISTFGNLCCRLWHLLPNYLIEVQPFHLLIYADEPLSWGDEKQTREIFENGFSHYN